MKFLVVTAVDELDHVHPLPEPIDGKVLFLRGVSVGVEDVVNETFEEVQFV
ncbi:hypothetical protein ACFSBX_18975 [Halobellus rarus]|uniref:Uncharacterized protein n=1 Tax=Halobellus rarus TaxID=1126237 RepID=A0ABD6CSD5_9EURY